MDAVKLILSLALTLAVAPAAHAITGDKAEFKKVADDVYAFVGKRKLEHIAQPGSVTLFSVAIGALAAYALGRFRFRGRSVVLYLMLSMTIFPQIAILGALYTMINDFHLYDRLGALVLTYLIFTLPFTVWVLTSFMRALPGDLEEAAYVDGATPLQVFYKVLLPLIAPGLVTTGLLAFIAAWNEYLYAVSFIQQPQNYTVPLAVTSFVGKSGSSFNVPWGQIMAATVIVTLPMITATLILQRRILAGLTAGAVKG